MADPAQIQKLILSNSRKDLSLLNNFILELKKRWSIPAAMIDRITLTFEEVFVNIVDYGYRDKEVHKIEIRAEKGDGSLLLTVKDDGVPFNPLEISPPDTTGPVLERKEGGLGILLIRQMADKVDYRREGETNILILHFTNREKENEKRNLT